MSSCNSTEGWFGCPRAYGLVRRGGSLRESSGARLCADGAVRGVGAGPEDLGGGKGRKSWDGAALALQGAHTDSTTQNEGPRVFLNLQ